MSAPEPLVPSAVLAMIEALPDSARRGALGILINSFDDRARWARDRARGVRFVSRDKKEAGEVWASFLDMLAEADEGTVAALRKVRP